MGINWREALHPRDRNGRFVRKASVGVRVSTRSASVTVGKRYPVIPGKVNVYGGVLLRVERARAGNGIIDRWVDGAQSRLIGAIPEGTLRNVAQSLAEGQSAEARGLRISGNGLRPQQPTIRVNRSSSRPGGHSQTTTDPGVPKTPRARAPRKPRAPRTRKVAA